MDQGNIFAIYITPVEGQPTHSVPQVRAVPGKGLEGDRYFIKAGVQGTNLEGSRQVTLIEIEALQAFGREEGIHLQEGEPRRNLVTRGVSLNHLVGKQFRVGEATLRGVRLCEPCNYLASVTHPGVLTGLVHRGGLRAEILNEGIIRVGDSVTVLD
jgi:MOSC domain-containing protein YiiM